MKISFNDMKKQINLPKQPEPIQPSPAENTLPVQVKKQQVNAELAKIIESCYLSYGFNHAKYYGWETTPFLKVAMIERSNGKKVLTLREADIAARAKINLNDSSVLDYLVHFGSHIIEQEDIHLITEDIPGLTQTIFELRRFFNRGVNWIAKKKYTAPPEQVENAKKALEKTTNALKEHNSAPWYEETVNGFNDILLRPEWMSEEDYQASLKNPRVFI